MAVTTIDVDTDIYLNSGYALTTAADSWFRAVDSKWQTLADCGSMCGSYSEAKAWAASYDARASELIDNARAIAEAVDNYGRILLQLGHNHALGDYFATVDAGGQPPAPPTIPQPGIFSCRVPLPSAGGPGQGLVDDGIGLVEQVGIIVPDGDTDKLTRAADTWALIATDAAATGLVTELERVAAAFTAVTAPESAHIDEDLTALKTSAQTALAAFGELSTSASSHRDGLNDLRTELEGVLRDLVEAVAQDMAITAAITIAASLVTFGAAGPGGAAIGAAKVATTVARFAPKIRTLVNVFTTGRKIDKGVDKAVDITRMKKELDRLRALGQRNSRPLTRGDEWDTSLGAREINTYTNNGSVDLNDALRRGGDIPENLQTRIANMDAGLAARPVYQGVVTRKEIDLPPEVLNQIRSGGWTENGYTSATRLPDGIPKSPWNNAKVTMHIQSKNGRDVQGLSSHPHEAEVIFPRGTQFQTMKIEEDPITGAITVFAREV